MLVQSELSILRGKLGLHIISYPGMLLGIKERAVPYIGLPMSRFLNVLVDLGRAYPDWVLTEVRYYLSSSFLGDTVLTIASSSSPHWLICLLACYMQGFVAVIGGKNLTQRVKVICCAEELVQAMDVHHPVVVIAGNIETCNVLEALERATQQPTMVITRNATLKVYFDSPFSSFSV
jgi:hypothetical protein